MLKKYLGIISLAAVFAVPSLAAAQSTGTFQAPQIQVDHIVLSQPLVSQGDTVTGTFEMINQGTSAASNIGYRVSLVGNYQKNTLAGTFYDTSVQQGSVFVPGNTSVSVPFTYTLPIAISGTGLGIEIQAYTSAGIPLGWSDDKLTVHAKQGIVLPPTLSIASAALELGTSTFPLQAGPVIHPGETPTLVIGLASAPKTTLPLIAHIDLYNRLIAGTPLTTTTSSVTLTSHTKTFSVALPLPTTARVYDARVTLETTSGVPVAPPLEVRYIVAGDIITIQSLTSDVSSVTAGNPVTLTLQYTGSPFDIRTGAVANQSTSTLSIVLSNELGTTIGTYSALLDPAGGTIQAPITVSANATAMTATATVTNNGKVIATYATNLSPNVAAARAQALHQSSLISSLFLIILSVILLLVILVIYFMLKKKKLPVTPLVVLAVMAVCGLTLFSGAGVARAIYYSPSNDFTISTPALKDSNGNLINPTTITPGSVFYVTGNLVAPDSNTQTQNVLFDFLNNYLPQQSDSYYVNNFDNGLLLTINTSSSGLSFTTEQFITNNPSAQGVGHVSSVPVTIFTNSAYNQQTTAAGAGAPIGCNNSYAQVYCSYPITYQFSIANIAPSTPGTYNMFLIFENVTHLLNDTTPGSQASSYAYGVTNYQYTVVAPTPVVVTPSVTLNASPTTVSSGGSTTLIWTPSGSPTSCTASDGGNGTNWNGSELSINGQHSQSVGPITVPTTFTITCTNSAGTSPQASVTVYPASGSGGTPPPSGGSTGTLYVSLSASPNPVSSINNYSTTLSWSAREEGSVSNYQRYYITCTAGDTSGSFTGWPSNLTPQNSSINGTIIGANAVGPLTATTNFSISCSDQFGNTGSANTTVNYPAPISSPSVTLTSNVISVPSGGDPTLTWTPSGSPATCTASNNMWGNTGVSYWNGPVSAVDGPHSITIAMPLNQNTTFKVGCYTSSGGYTSTQPIFAQGSSALVEVYVNPTASLSATASVNGTQLSSGGSNNSINVPVNTPVTLTWGSFNATACSSNNFTTNGSSSGSTSVTPTVSGTSIYSVTCTNPVAGGLPPATAYAQIVAGCPAGQTWNGSTCQQAPTPSGALMLKPTSCIIAAGQSTCSTVYATWTTVNAPNPALVDGNMNSILSTSSSQLSPGLQVWVAYPHTRFYLESLPSPGTTAGGTILDSQVATASCASGSAWNGSMCQASQPPSGTLTLTPPAPPSPYTSCTIAAGQSTCTNVYAMWSTANAPNPALVDGNVNVNSILSTSSSQGIVAGNGGAYPGLKVWVAYPQTVFYLENLPSPGTVGGSATGGTILDSQTATAGCATGSTWNGSICVSTTPPTCTPPLVLDSTTNTCVTPTPPTADIVSVDPAINGTCGSATLTWSITGMSSTDLQNGGSNGNIGCIAGGWNNNSWVSNPSNSISITGTPGLSTYTLTCTSSAYPNNPSVSTKTYQWPTCITSTPGTGSNNNYNFFPF